MSVVYDITSYYAESEEDPVEVLRESVGGVARQLGLAGGVITIITIV